MQPTLRSFAYSILIFAFAASAAHADEVGGLITFSAGTPARASEVNDNFVAVKTAVDGTHADVVALQQAVAALKDTVAALTTQLTALQSENATLASQLDGVLNSEVMALDPYLTVTGGTRPNVMFAGVNVQIVNGEGATPTTNGLGNLLVGYDEPAEGGDPICSLGHLKNSEACTSGGGVWSHIHKSGSHYIVVGAENNYSQYGAIVAGFRNSSTGIYASVTAGSFNLASAIGSSVSGGTRNIASASYASVSGGGENNATSGAASVSGGLRNTASNYASSVSGGFTRTAPGAYDWAAGSLLEGL